MRGSWGRAAAVAALVTWGSVALAQTGRPLAALQGTVKTGGRPVAGAWVTAQANASPIIHRAETDSHGVFSMRPIAAGRYTVIVTMPGFKTVTVDNATAATGTPAPIEVTLEPDLAARPLLVAPTDTVSADRLNVLPLVTRNALDFLSFLPSVDVPGTNRRASIAGLPANAIGVTQDGINIQDPATKSRDPLGVVVTPRLDAVAELSLTVAAIPAEDTAQGAALVRVVTRSGTARFLGTAYHSFRGSGLGSNSFFNDQIDLPKNKSTFNQLGVSEGGPLGRQTSGGAPNTFFFVNYEDARLNASATRTGTILSPVARGGVFQYQTGAGLQSVPLLTLAAANGQTQTLDPTVQTLLAAMQTGAATGRVIAGPDPNTQFFAVQNPFEQREHQPTVRLDRNLGRGRLTGTYTRMAFSANPNAADAGDRVFAGLGGASAVDSTQQMAQVAWRTMIGRRMTNDLRAGRASGKTTFGGDLAASDFANQAGFALRLPLVTDASASSAGGQRGTSLWSVDETLYFQAAAHRFGFGASFSRANVALTDSPVASIAALGFSANDPAAAMFTAAAFPGASAADLDRAKALYAIVTGRVSALTERFGLNTATNRYDPLASTTMGVRQDVFSLVVSDDWHAAPTVSLSYGLRWDVQRPFTATEGLVATAALADLCGVSGVSANGRGCGLFAPAVRTGAAPTFSELALGETVYRNDYKTFAPTLGMAWRPNVQGGLVRRIFGDPDRAMFYGGISQANNRNGLLEFAGLLGANPGSRLTLERSDAIGNLVPSGSALPLLLRSSIAPLPACAGAVTAACHATSPAFPIAAVAGQSINIMDPGIKTPFTRSWAGGFEQSLGPDFTVDARWVSTRDEKSWVTDNFNELNVLESGFVDEFRLAQANLQANLTAGRGATFAFFGPDTGTSPLPAYLMFFSGLAEAAATSPANYTSANFRDRAYLTRLSTVSPDALGALGDLWNNATFRANALQAGLSSNKYILNPDLATGGANITHNGGPARYDALQVAVRRRFTHGVEFGASYTASRAWVSELDTLHFGRYLTPAVSVVPRAFKMTWTSRVGGGWTVNGTARIQSGRPVAASGVRLVGMSLSELQKEFHERTANGIITMLPDEIVLNTRRAFSIDPTSATGFSALGVPTGRFLAPASSSMCIELYPGDCGEPRQIILRGPVVSRIDFNVGRDFKWGPRTIDVRFEFLNLLNAADVTPVFNPGAGANIFQATSGFQDPSRTADPGGRLGQIVWRLRW